MRMACLALTLTILGCCADPWPRETFTPEAWKALPWEERYRLSYDLLDSGLLEGASRERVVSLLGPPNGTVRPDRVSYLVRKRRIWSVIGEVKVLDVRFDAEGTVSRAFIRGT